jgi:hypothetical protein
MPGTRMVHASEICEVNNIFLIFNFYAGMVDQSATVILMLHATSTLSQYILQ